MGNGGRGEMGGGEGWVGVGEREGGMYLGCYDGAECTAEVV